MVTDVCAGNSAAVAKLRFREVWALAKVGGANSKSKRESKDIKMILASICEKFLPMQSRGGTLKGLF